MSVKGMFARKNIDASRIRSWNLVSSSGGTAEIMIYDEIGDWGEYGINASSLVSQLSTLDVTDILVRINSPGGDAFDGIAIRNAISQHPARVRVQIDGLAASAASIIATAGDEVTISPGAMMMIHDAMGVAVGPASEMRQMADMLDKLSDSIAGLYQAQTGTGTVETWRSLMLAETWYNADEAVAAGLADGVLKPESGDDSIVVQDVPDEDIVDDDGTVMDGCRPKKSPKKSPTSMWDLKMFKYPGRDSAPKPPILTRTQEPAPDPVPFPVLTSQQLIDAIRAGLYRPSRERNPA
jgi:ATP-dependent protease ClpP protease subunit